MTNNEIEIDDEEAKLYGNVFVDVMGAYLDAISIWNDINKETRKLLKVQYHNVGAFMNCHLMIERLIGEELIRLKKVKSINSLSRISFSEKLGKLPRKGEIYSVFIPAIDQLNKIRNELAHKFHARIDESMMSEIDKCVFAFNISDPDSNVDERIEKFTCLCLLIFTLKNHEVKNPFEKLKQKYPNFKELQDKMYKLGEHYARKILSKK